MGPDLNSEAGAEMTIEGGALVLRPPASPVRAGWAEAAQEIAEAGDDALVMGEFGNVGDEELVWTTPPISPSKNVDPSGDARITT